LGEPEKPHGIVIFAVLAPIYALLAINGGAYGIKYVGRSPHTSAAHALLGVCAGGDADIAHHLPRQDRRPDFPPHFPCRRSQSPSLRWSLAAMA
jgi:hypothetical protein